MASKIFKLNETSLTSRQSLRRNKGKNFFKSKIFRLSSNKRGVHKNEIYFKISEEKSIDNQDDELLNNFIGRRRWNKEGNY